MRILWTCPICGCINTDSLMEAMEFALPCCSCKSESEIHFDIQIDSVEIVNNALKNKM